MRKLLSFFVGLTSLGLGLIPLLHMLGIISFTFSLEGVMLAVLMVIGAIILFIDATDEFQDFLQWGSILSGIAIIAIGLSIIVGVFVPSVKAITDSVLAVALLKDILLIIAGFFQILGGFLSH
ncbi:MAG: hypothetical protein QW594_02190 [Candidatus Woesearchaeota archaeon]